TSSQKVTKKIGWGSTKQNKKALLSMYASGLEKKQFQNPSKSGLDECKGFVHDETGQGVEYSSLAIPDLEGHGDEVIADALAYYASRHVSVPEIQMKRRAEFGSYEMFRQQLLEQKRHSEEHRENWFMAGRDGEWLEQTLQ
ncbi:MAG: hypothetical protein DRP56_05150, partial [Planctomycetota bacterium]